MFVHSVKSPNLSERSNKVSHLAMYALFLFTLLFPSYSEALAAFPSRSILEVKAPAILTTPNVTGVHDGRNCLTYRPWPQENTVEHVSNPEYNVRQKQKPLLCGHRKFMDFPKLALAVRVTETSSLITNLRQIPTPITTEVVLWFEGPPTDLKAETALQAQVWNTLKGENHFQIYSSTVVGESRSFNRMARFSQNAELVLMCRDVDLPVLSKEVLAKVSQAFAVHPALAILSLGAGKIGTTLYGAGGQGVKSTEDSGFQLVDKIVSGPLVVRRTHFLTLGEFANLHCPGQCQAGYEQELSLRAWLAGYEVGLIPSEIPPPPVKGCEYRALPGMYSSNHLQSMRTHLTQAKAGPLSDPRLENCVALPTPKVPAMLDTSASGGLGAHCPNIDDSPRAALMVQYFRRPKNIKAIMKGLNLTPNGTEVMINNDSGGDHEIWRSYLKGSNRFLVYSHDIHEIRGYNRLGLLADSDLLVTLQDDDVPSTSQWLYDAIKLFNAHPKLIYMTGYRARSGADGNVGLGRGKIPGKDPKTGIPFMFVYKLVAGPLFLRRSTWLDLGMFNMNFSCAGDPGIHFEYEFSLRTWFRDYQAGIYDCRFHHHVGDWASTGTRANKKVLGRRREIGIRNSMNVKFMYRELHGNSNAILPKKVDAVHKRHMAGEDVDS